WGLSLAAQAIKNDRTCVTRLPAIAVTSVIQNAAVGARIPVEIPFTTAVIGGTSAFIAGAGALDRLRVISAHSRHTATRRTTPSRKNATPAAYGGDHPPRPATPSGQRAGRAVGAVAAPRPIPANPAERQRQ